MGETSKQPWWKKKWVWGVAGVVVVIGVVGNLLGLGGEREETTAAPTPSATLEVSTAPAAPSAQPVPEATAETPAGPSDEERGVAFDQAIRDAFGGVSSYAELAGQDGLTWPGYINGIRVDGGLAYVTLQVAPSDAGRDELGERAASALSTLLPATAFEGIDWIVVEDAGGVIISQEQPAPLT